MGQIALILFTLFALSACERKTETQENETPIVGILSQEVSYSLEEIYPGYSSYIAASYVKMVESAGARVVPILIGKDQEYYEKIMMNINGVLFPGGGTYFTNDAGYGDAGFYIYEIAKEMNDNGDYFPIWGTCLGFELLLYLATNRTEYRARCNSQKQSIPLNFSDDFKSSRMFRNIPNDIVDILSRENVTSNFHSYCVTKENMTLFGLDNDWRVMSENEDLNGFNFISTIESKKYPFYGIQFHPEKNIFEWVKNKNISHTANAVKANYYFGEFFISEVRKNKHSIEDAEELFIYNYQPENTGSTGSSFQQCYFFK